MIAGQTKKLNEFQLVNRFKRAHTLWTNERTKADELNRHKHCAGSLLVFTVDNFKQNGDE